ncbi:unnamed protein product [Macrosiphum euphorbiae]|uniref:Uncharacterized protein n=1 Tax=Macrosiphum euphorbiae TaxID=13131 RepID=A0AAV0Y579_9HEMI|nr:unnamed protein product [Macrosiphum euphorbiae]
MCILFGTSRKAPARKIQKLGQTIDWKIKTTYLSVTLDIALRLNKHVKVCIKKAKQARGALYPILNSRSPIPLSTRLSIYLVYIKPICLFAMGSSHQRIKLGKHRGNSKRGDPDYHRCPLSHQK